MADVNTRSSSSSKMIQDYVFVVLLFVILSSLNHCSCQLDSPRNIETFYPFPLPTPPVPPALPNAPPPPPSPSPSQQQQSDFPSRSSKKAVITAIAATAASAFVLAAILFLLFTVVSRKRRRDGKVEGGSVGPPLPADGSPSDFRRYDGDVKGFVVDEDGLDVLYWKKLSDEIHRGRSSTSYGELPSGDRSGSFSSKSPADQHLALASMAVPKAPAAPPPPPPPAPVNNVQAPPPPPPSKPAAPAPRPPPRGVRKAPDAGASGSGSDQVKMKALHWEKVNISHDRSNVWDEIEKGSFQYNGDMMEALFGVAVTRSKPKPVENPRANVGEASTRIFILDQRKSQNIAIVIKSLGVSRDELIESLLKGSGLNAETLEKLTRMAPTKEEVSEIISFSGDLTKLADAESFLYSLLKAVPSAFTRASEMLFAITYQYEYLSLKELLQIMELACRELRSHGIFLKLLEAILKAGNKLNAGTARGNAKGFSLTTLRKLSDYKSSDGKSTLLHFVVHEVIRNEGRRCAVMRTNSVGRQPAGASPQADDRDTKEEREKEYLRLGLPVVGGLSSEFSDVKKAANIDYDALKSTLASLANRVRQATELVANADSVDEGGSFVQEMREFLASAETEMKALQEEHDRVMELVKKTTHYYQAKASNDKNPVQLFVIVKDFLSMVDLACVEIARSLQQKKQAKPESGSGSGSSHSSAIKSRVSFPQLPKNFMSDKSSSSSEDDS